MKTLTLLIAFFISSFAIQLSQNEKNFVQKHPEIRVGIDIKWATIDTIDKNGNHIGIASDYLQIISRESGIKFKLVAFDNAENLYESLKNKKIDMTSAIIKMPTNSRHLKFSDPYISIPYGVFTREDDPKYFNMEDLNGKKVTVLKGFMVGEWIKENYPAICVADSYSIYDGLEKVYKNEASAFINDYPSTMSVLENTFLPNMIVNAPITKLAHVQIRMGIRQDFETLQAIINKVNASLKEEDVERLRKKWLSNNTISMLNFSSKETIWLDSNKEISFSSDPSWLPFEGYDKKTMQFFGIANEILSMVSARTGIKFKLTTSDSWNNAKEKLKNKTIQMLPNVSSSKDLKNHVNLSIPYLSIPFMIYGFEDSNTDTSHNFNHAKVAVNADIKILNYLEKRYPQMKIVVVSNREGLIEKLLNHEIDYFVTDSASTAYLINSKSLNNIVGLEKLHINYEPRIALSKDLGDIAITIINKAIESLSEEEIRQAQNKWIFVKSSKEKSTSLIFILLGSFILVVLLLYVIKLKRASQTKDENKQLTNANSNII